MEKNIEKLINNLNYNDLLLIKEACEQIFCIEKFRKVSNLCEERLKNKPINNISAPELFVLSIKDLTTKELLFIKDLFERAFGLTKKMSYKIICSNIEIIIDYRKRMLLTVLKNITDMSIDEFYNYLEIMPIDTRKKLAKICEIKVIDLKPKVLKKVYYETLDLGREIYE